MRLRIVIPFCAVLAAALLTGSGCMPQGEPPLSKALRARTDKEPTYNESARFLATTYLAKHDKDYVMWAMEYASLCILGGNYDAAREEMAKCYQDIQQRKDEGGENAAALSNEAFKLFKGEPHERALLCAYLGILHYRDGDYNNARIYCTRADMETATKADDMQEYRHDFGLAHFWLGKAYLKLGNEDNARVAFQKAIARVPRKVEDEAWAHLQSSQKDAREHRIPLEKESYRLATTDKEHPVAGAADMSASPAVGEMPALLPGFKPADNPVLAAATSPEEFASVAFQKDVNLTLVIETGLGPIRYLAGDNGAMAQIIRAPYGERNVMVYLDGLKAGGAFPLVDLFHHADTRGLTEKDKIQMTKGITQSILRQLPYVGSVAAYWNVQADHRYWSLMPGEVHVYAAKVKPGLYTVTLECLDSNRYLLPRYRQTIFHIPVLEGQENIYVLHTYPEADNVYVPPKEKQPTYTQDYRTHPNPAYMQRAYQGRRY